MVLKLDNLSNIYGILGISPTSNNFSSLSYNTSGGNVWTINNSNSSVISSNIETSNNFLLMEWSIGNNNNFIRRNGLNIASSTNQTWTLPNNSNIIIGNSNNFNFTNRFKGLMGEIIMFNRQLADFDRFQVEGYLSWKWGIQSSLPSNHPYKNTAPYLFLKSTYVQPFNPSNVVGLQLWLDASDNSTLTFSGSNVTQWADKSGFNRHATKKETNNPTYSATGFNNKPTINFAYGLAYLCSMPAGTTSKYLTVFIVYRKTGSAMGDDGLFARTQDSPNGHLPAPIDIRRNERIFLTQIQL
jgi:hypothetical protein